MGFAGTPEFAARALDAIHRAGHTIPIVLTRPDRPSGRGLRPAAAPVATLAAACGLDVMKPASLRDAATLAALQAIGLDVLVVAAYGTMLPPAVLAWPAHGCLNIHASLLPRWRGAAPIARAIDAGDRESGITVMQMDTGLDSGPIVRMRSTAIGPRETAGSLYDRLATLGGELIVEVLAALAKDRHLTSVPQPAEGVTWAPKIVAADEAIDWSQPAVVVDRRIRALAPAPAALTHWQGQPVKVIEAQPVALASERGEPGGVLRVGADGIDVACGDGLSGDALRIVRVKPAGGRTMPAAAFAAGRRVARGTRFD